MPTPARSARELQALVADFEACSLPLARWHHAEHLCVALFYLETLPEAEAVARVREGIQRLNAANGVVQTPDGGYHETLTLLFLRLIQAWRAGHDSTAPLPEKAAALIEALAEVRGVVLRHYSRERINGWDARTGWVEPDLAPLP